MASFLNLKKCIYFFVPLFQLSILFLIILILYVCNIHILSWIYGGLTALISSLIITYFFFKNIGKKNINNFYFAIFVQIIFLFLIFSLFFFIGIERPLYFFISFILIKVSFYVGFFFTF